jgi:site-specific recombinase XerD
LPRIGDISRAQRTGAIRGRAPRTLLTSVAEAVCSPEDLQNRDVRQGCGYKLANDGVDTRSLQAYLGHRNIQNTTRYTALAPDRFKSFWKD